MEIPKHKITFAKIMQLYPFIDADALRQGKEKDIIAMWAQTGSELFAEYWRQKRWYEHELRERRRKYLASRR